MSTPPAAPTPLTKEQQRRILTSPIHRRIKHLTYSSLAIGVLVPACNVAGLILGAVWAREIVQRDRWFILHYVAACVLSLLWGVYSFIFFRDIKYLAWPDQLQIDIGWMGFADGFLACFLFYIFYKMRSYGVLDVFSVACSTGCTTKLDYVKISPLVFAITTLAFGLLQLLLTVMLYRNPIINPPLDAHGMPAPQDPETGAPLPLDANGQPIVPEWLRPPASLLQKSSSTSGRSKKAAPKPTDVSSEESASSDEEKKPLKASAKASAGQMELGREKSRRKKSRKSGRW
ncbi:hypothetical protein JCM10213_004324 [Rhodosporidiobolus nylandii]